MEQGEDPLEEMRLIDDQMELAGKTLGGPAAHQHAGKEDLEVIHEGHDPCIDLEF